MYNLIVIIVADKYAATITILTALYRKLLIFYNILSSPVMRCFFFSLFNRFFIYLFLFFELLMCFQRIVKINGLVTIQ